MNNHVIFGDSHSWKHWKLIRESVDIEPPSPKNISIKVPGRDGELDLTEFITGRTCYENRRITFVFHTAECLSKMAWTALMSRILNEIHGRKLHITLEEDAEYFYVGRCAVDKFQSSRTLSTVTITCDCEPYKYKADGTKGL